MPHRPKFDEPWMDELDGHDCVQKSVTLGVKAGMVGKYCSLDKSSAGLVFGVHLSGCTILQLYLYRICYWRVNDVLQ